ncbi:MAG: DUF2934 domain-containing protein [Gammaproteobacteria bacterium]|nr:MAG: DUF2934 domain-containing protein [Gammaproteobacteria bacterium]
MSTSDEIIRRVAHQIWEAEGKPDGQSDRHWKQASSLAQSGEDAGLKRSIDPSEAKGPTEPEQPDQT